MDILPPYGVALWAGVALLCVALGISLTIRGHKKQQIPHIRQTQVTSSSSAGRSPRQRSRRCPSCGKDEDGPGASFCGFCGYTLEDASGASRRALRRQETSRTRLGER